MTITQPLTDVINEPVQPVSSSVTFSTYIPPDPHFMHYDGRLSDYREMPQRWLWQGRIPLGGVTLLDGDIGVGKSVFVQQLAACVSAGNPLPDHSATIQGGVVIVAPYEEAGKALYQRMVANGADTSRVRVLSFVPVTSAEEAKSGATQAYRHFQLPDDLDLLRAAMRDVDARLVILDPFLETLPDEGRMTQEKLRRILRKVHQVMIEMDATCLLTRQCPARGGMAHPDSLERSTHFLNVASSRLLLAPDPMQPDHILLSQAACRIQGLAPTISFTITSVPDLPRHPMITFTGPDALQAHDLLHTHPGTLHIKLLMPRLQREVTTSSEPCTLATLRTRFPHSTPSQVQRALRQLVQESILTRVGRGLYTAHNSKE